MRRGSHVEEEEWERELCDHFRSSFEIRSNHRQGDAHSPQLASVSPSVTDWGKRKRKRKRRTRRKIWEENLALREKTNENAEEQALVLFSHLHTM